MRVRCHRFAFAALLMLGACAPEVRRGPAEVVERRADAAPGLRGPVALRRAMLSGHNGARRAVGVPPLGWSDTLADDARRYARVLAASGRFEHSPQPQRPGSEGENLWKGTRAAYSYDEMVGHWVAERGVFVDGVTPGFSRTGRWEDAAHYSQIVWRDTRSVGCAVASSRRDDVLVCRYAPIGNVVGRRVF